eukprot:TRINITY_DN11429_c0_g1_i1.p1 TRINITY_DN11429_c0_g1~~TRINITY_DN11429_c0_g1_i1.p1  ORF type:complete len:443 (-),score=99.64 TRINITY_DN11429_c0_g1_i1:435-1763(-)
MTSTGGLAGRILELAGPEVRNEIYQTEQCRTGEARITSAGELPSRYIIHTVGPRYNEKYRTAAENALHGCYRSSLTLLKENKLTTITFPVVNSIKRGYPNEEGAHIAVRTVRRFLENFGEGISVVIFCMSDLMELYLYQRILPLYFPRNVREEIYSKTELPRDVGNSFGETVIEERKIRINAFITPLDIPLPTPVKAGSSPSHDYPPAQKIILNVHSLMEFGAMRSDADEEKKKLLSLMTKSDVELLEQRQLYNSWLTKARSTDLTEVEESKAIYMSGKDQFGRQIVVMVGHRLPEVLTNEFMDKVFMYFIQLVDAVVNKDYLVVYLHSLMENRTMPEWGWLQGVYNVLDNRYSQNLSLFYIVHPTWWLKLTEQVVTTFMVSDSKFWMKVKYVENLNNLFTILGRQQLVVPEEVLRFDLQKNGSSEEVKDEPKDAETFVNDL